MRDPRNFDPVLWVTVLIFGVPALFALGFVAYLFISVVFLGKGSACPLNICQ